MGEGVFSTRGLTVIALAAALLLIGASYFIGTHVQAFDVQTQIHVRICGNAITDVGEVCDDGTLNNVGGYGSSTALRECNADCNSFGPYCGDGVLQVRFTEQCDDGNNTPGDLCDASCQEEIPVLPRATGSPPKGSIPQQSLPPGTIPADTLTKVVLQGK